MTISFSHVAIIAAAVGAMVLGWQWSRLRRLRQQCSIEQHRWGFDPQSQEGGLQCQRCGQKPTFKL